MPKTDIKKSITDTSKKLLDYMMVEANIDVEELEDEVYKVSLESDKQKGLLIGRHGITIKSIQQIIGLIIRKKMGKWVRVVVDVGDWTEKQEEYLKDLAIQAADRAVETNQPQLLYNLNGSQRRIVHLELSENDKVSTESKGEGKDRYLVVSPKK